MDKTAPSSDVPTGLLDALLEQALPHEEAQRHHFGRLVVAHHPAGKEILALDGRSLAGLIVLAVRRQMDLTLGAHRSPHIRNLMVALPKISGQLLRREPDFLEEQLVALAETAVRAGPRVGELPLAGLLKAFENHAQRHGLGSALYASLTSLARNLETWDHQQVLEGIQRLLRHELPPDGLRHGDAWADTLLDALGAMPPGEEAAWRSLLSHCETATSAKPSSKWLAQAKEIMSRLDLVPVLTSCLDRIGEPGMRRVRTIRQRQYELDRTLLDDTLTDLLRGLVWCTGLVDDPALTAVVGKAADACFRKVEGHGPRNAKVANACVDTLSRLGTPAAVAQLSRLRSRVRHPSSRKQIEAALGRAADRLGFSKAELEEMSVPAQCLRRACPFRAPTLRAGSPRS